MFCEEHKGEKLNCFCFDEKKMLCSECRDEHDAKYPKQMHQVFSLKVSKGKILEKYKKAEEYEEMIQTKYDKLKKTFGEMFTKLKSKKEAQDLFADIKKVKAAIKKSLLLETNYSEAEGSLVELYHKINGDEQEENQKVKTYRNDRELFTDENSEKVDGFQRYNKFLNNYNEMNRAINSNENLYALNNQKKIIEDKLAKKEQLIELVKKATQKYEGELMQIFKQDAIIENEKNKKKEKSPRDGNSKGEESKTQKEILKQKEAEKLRLEEEKKEGLRLEKERLRLEKEEKERLRLEEEEKERLRLEKEEKERLKKEEEEREKAKVKNLMETEEIKDVQGTKESEGDPIQTIEVESNYNVMPAENRILIYLDKSVPCIHSYDVQAKLSKKTQVKGIFPPHSEAIPLISSILVCGGQDKNQNVYVASTFVIDLNSSSFDSDQKSDLTTARADHALLKVTKYCYCIGGYSGQYQKSVEIYDREKDKWMACPDLCNAGGNIAAVYEESSQTVYCFGGRKSTGALQAIQCLDLKDGLPCEDEWDLLEQLLPPACTFPAAACYQDKILILGENLKNEYLEFDIKAQKCIVSADKIPFEPGRILRNGIYSLNGGVYAISSKLFKLVCVNKGEWDIRDSDKWTGTKMISGESTIMA